MRIPRDFDRWMFDYKEGNLSHSENRYFENYMSENPQLNSDINAWNNSYVRKQNIKYPGISTLHKESKLKFYFSWVATILLIITSSIGAYSYLNQSNLNFYNLRQAKVNYIPISNLMPFTKSRIKTKTNSIAILKLYNQEILDQTQNINRVSIVTNGVNHNNKSKTENQNSSNKSLYSHSLIEIEINKINNSIELNSKNNSAYYLNNPTFKNGNSTLRVNKSKSSKSNRNRKYSKSFLRTLKNGYRKIERITGYPIGLTNLKDPEFIVPTANLVDINPGFVGGNGTTRFESKYRTQWLGSENNLQTSLLNFDTYIKSVRGGVGISLNSNNFNNGLLTDNKISLIYSPKFALSSKLFFEPAIKLSLGLMTVNQAKINSGKTFEVQREQLLKTIQSNEILTANNLWYKDYGLGFVLNSDIFYLGFNADNLAKHKQNVYGKNIKSTVNYTAVLGMDYQSRNKNMIFSPFITYQNNSTINEFWAGANFKYHWLTIGGGYSTKNDFSAAVGVKTKHFKLTYQYDMTTPIQSSQKMGSHSIGLRINTKRKH